MQSEKKYADFKNIHLQGYLQSKENFMQTSKSNSNILLNLTLNSSVKDSKLDNNIIFPNLSLKKDLSSAYILNTEIIREEVDVNILRKNSQKHIFAYKNKDNYKDIYLTNLKTEQNQVPSQVISNILGQSSNRSSQNQGMQGMQGIPGSTGRLNNNQNSSPSKRHSNNDNSANGNNNSPNNSLSPNKRNSANQLYNMYNYKDFFLNKCKSIPRLINLKEYGDNYDKLGNYIEKSCEEKDTIEQKKNIKFTGLRNYLKSTSKKGADKYKILSNLPPSYRTDFKNKTSITFSSKEMSYEKLYRDKWNKENNDGVAELATIRENENKRDKIAKKLTFSQNSPILFTSSSSSQLPKNKESNNTCNTILEKDGHTSSNFEFYKPKISTPNILSNVIKSNDIISKKKNSSILNTNANLSSNLSNSTNSFRKTMNNSTKYILKLNPNGSSGLNTKISQFELEDKLDKIDKVNGGTGSKTTRSMLKD